MTERGGGTAHASPDDPPDARPGPGSEPANDGRDESELERLDRQFDDLLQELRVMQTGIQVLFAFLLSLPFTQRFIHLDDDQRLLYFVTLLTSGAAVLTLLAPGAWHRALFAQRDKAHLVRVSHRFAIAGLAFVAVSICGVVSLIATFIYPGTTAAVVAGACLLAFLVLWLVLPVWRRVTHDG
jgi:hypothetical protein